MRWQYEESCKKDDTAEQLVVWDERLELRAQVVQAENAVKPRSSARRRSTKQICSGPKPTGRRRRSRRPLIAPRLGVRQAEGELSNKIRQRSAARQSAGE